MQLSRSERVKKTLEGNKDMQLAICIYGSCSQVLTDPSLWSQGLASGGGSSAFIPPWEDRHHEKGVARG